MIYKEDLEVEGVVVGVSITMDYYPLPHLPALSALMRVL